MLDPVHTTFVNRLAGVHSLHMQTCGPQLMAFVAHVRKGFTFLHLCSLVTTELLLQPDFSSQVGVRLARVCS